MPINDIKTIFMKGNKENFIVTHNIQFAVDYDTKLICTINTTQNSTDHYELFEILHQIKRQREPDPEHYNRQ